MKRNKPSWFRRLAELWDLAHPEPFISPAKSLPALAPQSGAVWRTCVRRAYEQASAGEVETAAIRAMDAYFRTAAHFCRLLNTSTEVALCNDVAREAAFDEAASVILSPEFAALDPQRSEAFLAAAEAALKLVAPMDCDVGIIEFPDPSSMPPATVAAAPSTTPASVP